MKFLKLAILFFIFLTRMNDAFAAGNRFNPACFQINPNPIIKSGDFYKGATWNDPSVIYDQGKFVMYASADNNFNQDIRIWRLLSEDGRHWGLDPLKPVLSATPESWDKKSVETPSVVKFKNKYYLFYTGYPKSLNNVKEYKIGYAVSDNGIDFKKFPTPLVFPSQPDGPVPTLEFDQYVVAEPGAVVVGDRMMVYFTAIGADQEVYTTLQTIGMVETTDGIHWSASKQVMIPDQKYYPRNQKILGFSSPGAAVINGEVHLFASIAREEPYEQIGFHHAVSKDGRTNWDQDTKSFLDKSTLPWAKSNLVSPSVLQWGNKVYFWFAGHKGSNLGIGNGVCS